MAGNTEMKYRFALLLGLAGCFSAQADTVLCNLTYGGETRQIEASPVASPYTVAPTKIGSFFLFRIVFQDQPADLASIKLYTYADRDSGPSIIHQASYTYPLPVAVVDGFTGQQSVYEPMRDGELQYSCALKTGSAAK